MSEVMQRVKAFHVKPFRSGTDSHVSRESFSDAELSEDHVEQVLDVDTSRHASERITSRSQVFRSQIQPSRGG
jgi:hypothetical protein